MRVIVYPADKYGCGHYRLIWPAQALKAQGLDVTVMPPVTDSGIPINIRDDQVVSVTLPGEYDVAVFQRITHRWMAQAVTIMRAQGVAVVLDIDDDLSAIHPANEAFHALHPRGPGTGQSWQHLVDAARNATLVTVSAHALAGRYGHPGRTIVLPNCVPGRYLDIDRQDSPIIGWGGTVGTHPDDLQQVGNAIARLQRDGGWFSVVGPPQGVVEALRLDPGRFGSTGTVSILNWPFALAKLGVGIAPLADTRFNSSKSYLKPLEMSAVGVPWVASPRPEYRRLHADGAGLLADKPKDWYRQLRTLVDDPARRADLSAAGRELARRHTYQARVHLWGQAWTDAYYLQKTLPAG